MTSPASSIQVSEAVLDAGMVPFNQPEKYRDARRYVEAIYLAMKAKEPLPQGDDDLVDDLVVRLTEHAIMELDADEENTLQIEAWGKAAEKEIRAALARSPQGDEAPLGHYSRESQLLSELVKHGIDQDTADQVAQSVSAALVGSKPLETVPPEVRIWDAYDKAEGISWDDTPPMGDDVRERVARVIELALERHGVPVERFEGTLDDADAAITAIGSQSIAPECVHCGAIETDHEPSGCCGDGGGSTFSNGADQ